MTEAIDQVDTALSQPIRLFIPVNTAFVRAMYKKGTGNDKQKKDAGNQRLCPYRNFSQAIMSYKAQYDTIQLFNGGTIEFSFTSFFCMAV